MADGGSKISKKPRSNRAAMSCDRCRHRKTKCNKPTDGPCDYCRNIDEECSFDIAKRRQKPYYFVSEEEYRLLYQICKQWLPGEDLSIPNLRRLASQSPQATPLNTASMPTAPDATTESPERTRDLGATSAEREDVPLPEIVNLHEDIGCLLTDAQGENRYMGAESGMSFNTAVKSWILNTAFQGNNKDIIPSMVKVVIPAAKFQPKPVTPPWEPMLPKKDIVLACSSCYFEEVHSLYWIFSSEEFHSRLEATYTDASAQQTHSWLCSLHSIVAMGALCVRADDGLPDEQLARSSLETAKFLASKLCDEADLDSVRALILLALALVSNGYTNSAYLHTGIAVRIAFSLGLHLDKYLNNRGLLSQVHARRLWWTLFLFDQDLSLHLGKPCMSGSSAVCPWQPPLPSEQVVNPGSYTPQDYLRQCVSLAQLKKDIRHKLYTGPIQEGQRLSLSNFEEALKSLKNWLDDVPPHLSTAAPVPPLHRRSVATLHLRYWNAVMLVTRPFLLCSLLRGNELVGTPKQRHFDRLGMTCVSAAEASLDIFEAMAPGVLSSLVLVDFFFALQVLQVVLAACLLYRSVCHQGHVRRCMRILQTLGTSAYPKHLLPEILFEVQKFGLVDEACESPRSPGPFHNHEPAAEGSSETDSRVAVPHDEYPDRHPLLRDFYLFDDGDQFMEQLMDIAINLPTNYVLPGIFSEQEST